MMFRTAALAIFFAATTTTVEGGFCKDWEGFEFDMGPTECRSKNVFRAIRKAFGERPNVTNKCRGGAKRNDIPALFDVANEAEAIEMIEDLCEDALLEAAKDLGEESWDQMLGQDDLELFFQGDGYLNKETGNFKNNISAFNKKGGDESFIYIGEDPTKNDHYPTTEQSYNTGEKIKNFFNDHSKTKYMKAPTNNFECAHNTAMCCWHRDRQYLDNNGNCGHKDCANQNPGDNTDLCWTETSEGVFPYPGDETEKDLHCHGLSWSDDSDDINTRAKWNSLFYVSLYDHMYKRGYVESVTNDEKIMGSQPMCGCIEDMAPVARADCSEVVGKASYKARFDPETQTLKIEKVDNSFELEFQACEGYKYVEDFDQTDYANNPNSDLLKDQDNDLAGFVYRQWLEGKIDDAQVDGVDDVLVGYYKPEIKNDDDLREQACQEAFEETFPDLAYEEKEIEVETNNIDA